MCARALAGERLVEEAPVVETGQRVEVGLLTRFAEAVRVLDRRPGMHCQTLEQEHVLVRVLVAARAREDGQVPESPVLARQRHGEAAADRRLLALPALELGIGVRHRDRPGEPAVRRAGDRVPLGLLDREAESRDERLSALWLEA